MVEGEHRVSDQARTGWFRVALFVQLLAAGSFGVAPYVAPAEFARAFNLVGDEPYLLRLAGSATIGYAAAALLGLFRPAWTSLRIPIASTFTFNLSAAAASLVTIDETGLAPLPLVVGLAAGVFAAVSGYWLWRNEGPSGRDAGEALEPGFRATQALATVAASAIGLWQLLLPRAFATFFGISGADLVIIRLAGAATLGFGVAGLLSVIVDRWPAVRVQTVSAIAANVAAAIASAIYLAQGGRSWLGVLFLVAAGALVLSLTAWAARAAR
jgi:hypothetical protein